MLPRLDDRGRDRRPAPERLDDVFLFVAEDSTVTIERQGADGSVLRSPPPPTLAVSPAAAARRPPGCRPAPTPASAPATAPDARRAKRRRPPPTAPHGRRGRARRRPRRGPRRGSGSTPDQLDDLVGLAGELAVLSDNLQGLREVPGAQPWVHTLEALERVSRQIRDTTLDLRMVPVDELFSRFPRVVRDLADRSGKEIELRIVGQDTRLDRTIVERLSDPMIHLIRNAVDHALETPAGAAGRRASRGRGGSRLSAGHEGDRVAIRVEDDGRGPRPRADRPQGDRAGAGPGRHARPTTRGSTP